MNDIQNSENVLEGWCVVGRDGQNITTFEVEKGQQVQNEDIDEDSYLIRKLRNLNEEKKEVADDLSNPHPTIEQFTSNEWGQHEHGKKGQYLDTNQSHDAYNAQIGEPLETLTSNEDAVHTSMSGNENCCNQPRIVGTHVQEAQKKLEQGYETCEEKLRENLGVGRPGHDDGKWRLLFRTSCKGNLPLGVAIVASVHSVAFVLLDL